MKRILLILALAFPLAAQNAGHWATVNGHRIYYERAGSGRPVVMLHGGGNTIHGSFSNQLEEFAKSHEVIAPEQIGQGHTPDVDGPLTYGAMADDTAALLTQLHVRDADIVGWSDGGNIALILAVRHPELVRRLVVSGANFAPGGLPPKDLADMRRHQQELRKSKPFEAKLVQMWLTGPTTKELSPALLARIQKPVVVMAGDHDAILLEHTLALFHALPQGRLCIFPGSGHGTFIQRPRWVNAIVLSFFSE